MLPTVMAMTEFPFVTVTVLVALSNLTVNPRFSVTVRIGSMTRLSIKAGGSFGVNTTPSRINWGVTVAAEARPAAVNSIDTTKIREIQYLMLHLGVNDWAVPKAALPLKKS
ncbi:hypothetical protein OMP38_01150 [Cohnella ginsengisoli]|uniref:Uncharacterized protein n=1 Tax=Cohnella ginsengisoli TaxID=425004 RepID=A0A9X4KCH2_9BACL|nr:hypothetical protein [Cohnella ginsengisoli]MDG0789614.1 hypothetical protein [Cohnella ginsengisoli]